MILLSLGGERFLAEVRLQELQRAGADLALVAIASADLDETAAAIEALGRAALPLAIDIRDFPAFGSLDRTDILVNSAGMSRSRFSGTAERFPPHQR